MGARWRLSIREITEKEKGYEWTTYLVQGWKVDGKWQRRKFKTLREAEAFKASKAMELIPDANPVRMVPTELSQARVREAELAFTRLDEFLSTIQPGAIRDSGLVAAVDFYVDHLRQSHAVERVPILTALEACLSDKTARGVLRHRSSIQLRSSIRLFSAWLRYQPRFHTESLDAEWSAPVSEITAEDITGYLAGLRGKAGLRAAPKTLNNTRADIRGFLAWCGGMEADVPIPGCSRRWISKNPASEVSKVQAGTSSPTSLGVEEARRLMRQLEERHPSFIPFFALALFAGIRPGEGGELRKLAASEFLKVPCAQAGGRPLIDHDRKVITILPGIAKTGRKRVIPMQANLSAWLAAYPGPIIPPKFQAGLKEIRKQFPLPHDVLRHSFISYRTVQSGSKARTALEAGNSEAIIDAHYLNLPTESEAAEFWGIRPVPIKSQK